MPETVAEQVAIESQPVESSHEDLLCDQLAKAKAQIKQLKNQSQSASTGI